MLPRSQRSTLFPYTTLFRSDIKPGNILLSESGDTKVSDFGASFQQRHGQETTQITGVGSPAGDLGRLLAVDRKSTRLNSCHTVNSYADFCLQKRINVSATMR